MFKIFTAPMAGVTDYTFREILHQFSPDLVFAEMVSINAINAMNRKTLHEMLKCHEGDAIQLFGTDIDLFVKAAKYLESLGIRNIDINAGCPMKKITNIGAGAAMLADHDHVYAVLDTLRSELLPETQLSIKYRLGYKEHKDYINVAKIAEKVGCAHITVHGRTREQMYSGVADWEAIKHIKSEVSIPVIGNGDIFDARKDMTRIRDSGVDGVMLARGLMGNPWLIRDIREMHENGNISQEITHADKINMAITHVQYEQKNNPDKDFVYSIRKHLCWYLKGIPGGSQIRQKINTLENYDDIVSELISLRDR